MNNKELFDKALDAFSEKKSYEAAAGLRYILNIILGTTFAWGAILLSVDKNIALTILGIAFLGVFIKGLTIGRIRLYIKRKIKREILDKTNLK
jgi:K+-transporting ATPase A subunit